MIENSNRSIPEGIEANSEIENPEQKEVRELSDKAGEKLESSVLPDVDDDFEAETNEDEKAENVRGSKDSFEKSKENSDVKDLPKKMEPPVVIQFRCPEEVSREEFARQLKAQERGLNGQSVQENMENRQAYQARKETSENGNGRAKEAAEAQRITREKAYQSRIASNIKSGMSYKAAREEADSWIKTQAALHNPDQIAGGSATKVSRMGDANVNSSIGSQWRNRVKQLEGATNDFAKNYSNGELSQIKMNVKLEVV